MDFQVVVLAGGTSKKLVPLVSKEVPKSLLPVANRPVLSYVLELLEQSNLKDLIVVVEGEDAALLVGGWISSSYVDRLHVVVAAVPEEVGTAGALRAIAHHLTATDILVVSGDLVCDISPGAVAAAHRRHDAVVTAMFCFAPVSGSPESGSSSGKDKAKKPGRYNIVGLDPTEQFLLHIAAGAEIEKDIRVQKNILRAVGQNLFLGNIPSAEEIFSALCGLDPKSALGIDGITGHFRSDLGYPVRPVSAPLIYITANIGIYGVYLLMIVSQDQFFAPGDARMEIRADLMDAHLYAFKRAVLQEVLTQKPTFRSLKQDVLPYLVRSQLRSELLLNAVQAEENGNEKDALDTNKVILSQLLANASTPSFHELYALGPNGAAPVSRKTHRCCAYIASKSKYCARLNSLQEFYDINRDIIGDASHLSGYSFSAQNNVIHPSAVLGSKTTVGPQCMLGEGSQMGDKCSVKRSVIGRHCRIGSNVKVVNSVIMNHVTIGDGCSIQGSVVCSNVQLQERAVLRDCQIGAGFVVTAGCEYKGESLTRK